MFGVRKENHHSYASILGDFVGHMSSTNSQTLEVAQREKGFEKDLNTRLTVIPQVLSKSQQVHLSHEITVHNSVIVNMATLTFGPLRSNLVFKEFETITSLLGSLGEITKYEIIDFIYQMGETDILFLSLLCLFTEVI